MIEDGFFANSQIYLNKSGSPAITAIKMITQIAYSSTWSIFFHNFIWRALHNIRIPFEKVIIIISHGAPCVNHKDTQFMYPRKGENYFSSFFVSFKTSSESSPRFNNPLGLKVSSPLP